MRWNARLRAASVEPSGRVSLRKASSRAAVGRSRIQPIQSVEQPPLENDFAVICTLSARRIWAYAGTVEHSPPEALEPFERGVLDDGFCNARTRATVAGGVGHASTSCVTGSRHYIPARNCAATRIQEGLTDQQACFDSG